MVVVVVISGGIAMFFYTSFQKGLIIFYSLGQEFCFFFCLTRFKWSSGRWLIRRKSRRWLSVWDELISVYERLGRYLVFAAPQPMYLLRTTQWVLVCHVAIPSKAYPTNLVIRLNCFHMTWKKAIRNLVLFLYIYFLYFKKRNLR